MKKKKEKTKLKKVINIIEYLIICIVILFNSILIFKSVKNPNKTPDMFGIKAFIIISGSMSPTIEKGDVVVVRSTEDVVKDQIIAFRNGGTVIVHRLIDELTINNKKMFKTKGDFNESPDIELVSPSKVEGFVFNKIRYIGTPLMFLYENLYIVIVAAVLIFIIRFYFNGKNEKV